MFVQTATRILAQLHNQELTEGSFGDDFPSVNAMSKLGPLTRDDMQKLVIALSRDMQAVSGPIPSSVDWKRMGYYEREAWAVKQLVVSQHLPIYKGILELIDMFQLDELA